MTVVVLGMHKSGTSLVAEALHAGGVDMGDFDHDLGYDQSNKHERLDTQAINRSLLNAVSVPTWRGYRMAKRGTDQAGHPRNADSLAIVITRRIDRVCAASDISPAHRLVDELDTRHSGSWGFKDPRTVLVWPYWQRALPDPTLVAVYRGFHQVMRRYPLSSRRVVARFRAARSWIVHNQALVALAESQPRLTLLSYESLMGSDDEYARLCDAVGVALPDRRDAGLHRSRASGPQRWLGVPDGYVARAERIERRLTELRSGQLSAQTSL